MVCILRLDRAYMAWHSVMKQVGTAGFMVQIRQLLAGSGSDVGEQLGQVVSNHHDKAI